VACPTRRLWKYPKQHSVSGRATSFIHLPLEISSSAPSSECDCDSMAEEASDAASDSHLDLVLDVDFQPLSTTHPARLVTVAIIPGVF
jgi:hypothetical protein